MEQWLRGSERTWRATDFRSPPDSAETIPVWLSLYDADSFLYGGDDHADLHPGYRRRNVGVIYPIGTVVERTTVGGSAYSGSSLNFDGDRAEIRYRIETFGSDPPNPPPPPPRPATSASASTTPAPPAASPPPPPPPAPAGSRRLRPRHTTFTVRNQGTGRRGRSACS